MPTTPLAETDGYTRYRLDCDHGGRHIYGEIYVPNAGRSAHPTVVLSHGYSVNHSSLAHFADLFASAGYLCYVFDFCGGGHGSQSEGRFSADMSVLTEARDLGNVIDFLKSLDMVDVDNIFLLGESQGGYVSAYVAAKRPGDVRALILFYPAFMIEDFCKRRPLYAPLVGVSMRYLRDGRKIDIYREIPGYTGNVLIIHGDHDEMVDLSYARRARDAYASATLLVVPGGHHGFYGTDALPVAQKTLTFLQANTLHTNYSNRPNDDHQPPT